MNPEGEFALWPRPRVLAICVGSDQFLLHSYLEILPSHSRLYDGSIQLCADDMYVTFAADAFIYVMYMLGEAKDRE